MPHWKLIIILHSDKVIFSELVFHSIGRCPLPLSCESVCIGKKTAECVNILLFFCVSVFAVIQV